ncbi:heterokaryon incompatibility protein-domain-containing protein [Podospora didyma]|uniref:Heterokaryon incompatibility protein-domain-containing protein n=1 Tax=Podospora didyma TaxID=330526 RepID=A0AAE0TW51_9PEZI|nr:heterokaryon incompatibility protein-domain-containing protein [Podospora didyma]
MGFYSIQPLYSPCTICRLSYCWVGEQLAKITLELLPQYKKQIPLNSLPLTIRDAVAVVEGIGKRYLWVDALCIVQDDEEDVNEQVSQMQYIYRKSWVTISAAAAKSNLRLSNERQNFHHSDIWAYIVRRYTKLDLIFPSDKLPTIAAIAEDYSRSYRVTDYLAGMWKENFLHQCIWRRASKDEQRTRRPAMYRAPSWTWASLDGPISPWLSRHKD